MKHIGTIIDESYFQSYQVIKGDNEHTFKICPYCMEAVDKGFSKVGKNGGFAGTLPHECKSWIDEARHRIGVVERDLAYKGFIFLTP